YEPTTYATRHRVQLYVQPQCHASVPLLDPPGRVLTYSLPDFGLTFEFEPTDYTQVNAGLNRVLVRRAVGWLKPAPGEAVPDFFCGLGNFTLPIARQGAQVVGVEVSRSLVRRAEANAARNGLTGRARFAVANLFEATREYIDALCP